MARENGYNGNGIIDALPLVRRSKEGGTPKELSSMPTKHTGYELPCEVCGKMFYQRLSRITRTAHQFCSMDCSRAYRQPIAERFWEKVDCSGGEGACWPWITRSRLPFGTDAENTADMIAKGRGGSQIHPERLPRGERHCMAKLTEADVRAIRVRYANGGVSYAYLGRDYGVSAQVIGGIINRLSWRHVE
jgi:hypothetical protein